MDNLKKLLVYFIDNSPKMLSRTDLMKYVYTFEYYYYQLKKEQFTDTKFVRYHFGPNDKLVVDTTYELQSEGYLNIIEEPNGYNSISYRHKRVEGKHAEYSLPEEAELIACFIIDCLGKKTYQGVIDFAYSTPPMKTILQEEELCGKKIHGRVLDMGQKENTFKSTRQQKAEAKARLRARKPSACTDEQYYEHMYEQFELFGDLRRRSNIVDNSEIQR